MNHIINNIQHYTHLESRLESCENISTRLDSVLLVFHVFPTEKLKEKRNRLGGVDISPLRRVEKSIKTAPLFGELNGVCLLLFSIPIELPSTSSCGCGFGITIIVPFHLSVSILLICSRRRRGTRLLLRSNMRTRCA